MFTGIPNLHNSSKFTSFGSLDDLEVFKPWINLLSYGGDEPPTSVKGDSALFTLTRASPL